jgi:hypothetical protein
MPAAEPYTGVPEQQAASGQPGTATTLSTAAPTNPGTGNPDTGQTGREQDLGAVGGQDEQDHEDDPDTSILERYLIGPAKRALPYVGGGVLLYLVAVPIALATHRRRRRARATTPDERITLAWVEALEDAALVGFRERASDTYAERADRLSEMLPTATASALALARARETSDYSPDGAAEQEAVAAAHAAEQIAVVARSLASRPALVGRWLDPRPQLLAWRRDRGTDRRHIDTVATADSDSDRPLLHVGAGD